MTRRLPAQRERVRRVAEALPGRAATVGRVMGNEPMWTSNEPLPVGDHALVGRDGKVAYRVSVSADGTVTMTLPTPRVTSKVRLQRRW